MVLGLQFVWQRDVLHAQKTQDGFKRKNGNLSRWAASPGIHYEPITWIGSTHEPFGTGVARYRKQQLKKTRSVSRPNATTNDYVSNQPTRLRDLLSVWGYVAFADTFAVAVDLGNYRLNTTLANKLPSGSWNSKLSDDATIRA